MSAEALASSGESIAVVETAFAAELDEHLTVAPGQVVEVIDRSNSSWWKVSSEAGEGFVPTGRLSDGGASVEALIMDIHVHIDAADDAHAEVEHQEQLQAAMDEEHDAVQAEIAEHRAHLTLVGVDHALRLPDSAPGGFHYFRPPHHHIARDRAHAGAAIRGRAAPRARHDGP